MKYKNLPPKPHKYWFYIGICAFLVLIIAITAFTMQFLWNKLEIYEKDTPTYALENYTDMLAQKKYDEIITATNFKETDFCKKADYIKYLGKLYNTDLTDMNYIKVLYKDSKPNSLYYELHAGDTNLGVVELSENTDKSKGKWTITPPSPTFLEPIYVEAPSHIKVFANDVLLTKQYIEKENIALPQIATVKSISTVPTMTKYKIDGFIEKPKISAKKSDDTACVVEEKDGLFHVYSHPSAEKQKEYQAIVLECAQSYAKFITRDGKLAELRKHIYKDSDFYKVLDSYSSYWYLTHESYRFENVQIEDVFEYSPEYFTCEIAFDQIVTRKGKDHKFHAKYEMTLVLIDSKPLISGLMTK